MMDSRSSIKAERRHRNETKEFLKSVDQHYMLTREEELRQRQGPMAGAARTARNIVHAISLRANGQAGLIGGNFSQQTK
jgi:hypothetical protein